MVRVRFAPSPTGYVHIGSLRTAIYCYLYAKKNNGNYILRIEDTDRTRLVQDSLKNLINEMNWTGIVNDEGVITETEEKGQYGPYIQSKRLPIYKKYVEELIEKKDAYYCFCSKERLEGLREKESKFNFTGYDRHCRDIDVLEAKKRVENGENYVVRMKVPLNETVEFNDLVKGVIKTSSLDIDDQVILKQDGYPTYHLAVVVDDHLMKITHIIRGEEWLSSTPKHVLLYKYFGWDMPKFIHLPNILNENRKKLSKRESDVSVSDFREKGYLKEALINYLTLIGWSPKSEIEFLSLEEMIELFDFDGVQKSGGVFDINKLKHFNNHYIKNKSDKELYDLLKFYKEYEDYEKVLKIINLVKEKIDLIPEFIPYIDEFYKDNIIIEKEEKALLTNIELVKKLYSLVNESKYFEADDIKDIINSIKKEFSVKGKELFMPIRISITGVNHGSDLIRTINILGKDRVLKRIESVIKELEK